MASLWLRYIGHLERQLLLCLYLSPSSSSQPRPQVSPLAAKRRCYARATIGSSYYMLAVYFSVSSISPASKDVASAGADAFDDKDCVDAEEAGLS